MGAGVTVANRYRKGLSWFVVVCRITRQRETVLSSARRQRHDRKRPEWMPGGGQQSPAPQTSFVMGKLKPLLITAAIAVAAVFIYNRFLAGKFGLPVA